MNLKYYLKAYLFLFISFAFIYNLKAEDGATYKITNFSLHQKNWEDFSLSFKTTSSNYAEELHVTLYKVEVFGEEGTLLQTFKNSNNFSINDINAGSKEKLTFRLTIEVNGESLSKETTTTASEKSVIVANEVDVPLEDHISIGNVHVDCQLMRRKFSNPDKWEKVGNFNDVGVTLFISNGSNSDYVEVPLSKKSSSFDLATFKYFDDLKMQLEKDLYKTNTAELRYYYQFNWDRNVYVVYGGSKSIDKDKTQTVAYSFSRDMLQKFVNKNNPMNGVSLTSAEK